MVQPGCASLHVAAGWESVAGVARCCSVAAALVICGLRLEARGCDVPACGCCLVARGCLWVLLAAEWLHRLQCRCAWVWRGCAWLQRGVAASGGSGVCPWRQRGRAWTQLGCTADALLREGSA